MEIILDRHLVTMEKFVAERKMVRRRAGSRRRSDATLGRADRF
jgi:hypothetical protein